MVYITDMYDEVYAAYGNDEQKFLSDVFYEEGPELCEVVYRGDEVASHKSTNIDIVFKMNKDGRTFRFNVMRDNCGYWGEGETYFDYAETHEVEQKEITVTKWVKKK